MTPTPGDREAWEKWEEENIKEVCDRYHEDNAANGFLAGRISGFNEALEKSAEILKKQWCVYGGKHEAHMATCGICCAANKLLALRLEEGGNASEKS